MKAGGTLRWMTGLVWLLCAVSCENGEKKKAAGEGADLPAATGYVLARPHALPPAGTKGHVSGRFEMVEAPMTLKMPDEQLVGTMTTRTEKAMRYEVLSATEVKILVEKDRDTQEMTLKGERQPRPPKVSPIEGQALTFTLLDGAWVASLDGGGELSDEQREKTKRLSEKLGGSEKVGIYGTGPRTVGEDWEIDPKHIPGMGVDSNFQGTFHLKFDRVEDYEGHRCAVLLGSMKVVGTPREDDESGLEINVTASVTTYRSLEHLEDLKMELAGEMSMSGSPQPGVSMAVRGPLLIQQKVDLVLP